MHPKKLNNREKILKVFRSNRVLTVRKLADETEIGLTTIKKYVAAELKEGSLIAGDTAESTGGRKPQQFMLNADYQYYFVLIIDNNNLHFQTLDYCFNTVEEVVTAFEMPDYLKTVEAILKAALKKHSRVGAVCFSLPCVVNSGTVIDWYYNPSMNGFNLKEHIESCFGIPAVVQNDMKLTAIAKTAIPEYSKSTLATVQFGHNGIGVAAAVEGSILNGYSGFAGEVSFIHDKDKNIMSIEYPAKIVNSLIVFINPQKLFFYNSERQNNFSAIFEEAVKGLPDYAIPGYSAENDYLTDITAGLTESIYRCGYFNKGEENE